MGNPPKSSSTIEMTQWFLSIWPRIDVEAEIRGKTLIRTRQMMTRKSLVHSLSNVLKGTSPRISNKCLQFEKNDQGILVVESVFLHHLNCSLYLIL